MMLIDMSAQRERKPRRWRAVFNGTQKCAIEFSMSFEIEERRCHIMPPCAAAAGLPPIDFPSHD